MCHFGSEENHGGYLGQERRFRPYWRWLWTRRRSFLGTMDIRRVFLGNKDMDGDHLALPCRCLVFYGNNIFLLYSSRKNPKGLLHLVSRCAENHDGYNSWSKWNKLKTIVKYHEMKLMSTDWSTIDPQKTLEDHSRFLMKLKTLAALCLLCQLLLVTVFCLHNFRQCLSSSMDKGCLPSHLWMCKGHLYNP